MPHSLFYEFTAGTMKKQHLKFRIDEEMFRCPLCKSSMNVTDAGSLVCGSGHCFDISSKGYVNFLPNSKQSKCYDEVFFENRRKIFGYGLYRHVADEIAALVSLYPQKPLNIADAGCGEGYYSLDIADKFSDSGNSIFALDFSRDGIQLASKGGNDVKWLVSDLSNIPLRDGGVNIVLNIFSPANYAEFRRVLKVGGALIKVVPGENHMTEIRQIVSEQTSGNVTKEYSNRQVVDVFERNFAIRERIRVTRAFDVTEDMREAVINMTPLTFGIGGDDDESPEESKKISFGGLDRITVDAEILISYKDNETTE